MHILVTGGAGFIGSHLVDRLLKEGNKVAVIDNFSLGKHENIHHNMTNPNFHLYIDDITDIRTIIELLKNNNFDAILHVAALPRVQFSIEKPEETFKTNVIGTMNILEAARICNVKRVVFSSSSSVYGNQEKIPLKEDMIPNPMSPYALHKLIGEQLCKQYNVLFGIETISLRYFNVFGPRLDVNGDYSCLIPKFIKKILGNETPTIFGDGEQTRDFTYVDDVVEANILAMSTKNNKCFGETFNIGTGYKKYSVNEVTKEILNLTGKNIKPKYGQPVIEPRHTLADITNAKEMLGWQPKVDFRDGLGKTFEHISSSLK